MGVYKIFASLDPTFFGTELIDGSMAKSHSVGSAHGLPSIMELDDFGQGIAIGLRPREMTVSNPPTETLQFYVTDRVFIYTIHALGVAQGFHSAFDLVESLHQIKRVKYGGFVSQSWPITILWTNIRSDAHLMHFIHLPLIEARDDVHATDATKSAVSVLINWKDNTAIDVST